MLSLSEDPGSHHIHFFWDICPPATVGTNAAVTDQNPWVVWDTDPLGRKVFDQFAPGDVPDGATEICAVVANFEHEVHQSDIADLTASCVGLP